MKIKSYLLISALLVLSACGGKKTKSSDAADSTAVLAVQDSITTVIKAVYAAAAHNEADIELRFCCHAWRESEEAVGTMEDASEDEMMFFDMDCWTGMQDSNPEDLQVRDIRFDQLDMEKGTAVVSFIVDSSVQTVKRRLTFCREDGTWRVHDIVRFYDGPDGKEVEYSYMDGMQRYLNRDGSERNLEDVDPEQFLVPDLSSDRPLDLSDGKDEAAKWFPVWDASDVYEDEGVLHYDLNLGYDQPLQRLYQPLPGKPLDLKEVNRVILIDLNQDGHTDALVCLGRYGSERTLYFDAYLWDEDELGGSFVLVKDFRRIPNPAVMKLSPDINGRNGNDQELWGWVQGKEVRQAVVIKDHYIE